MDSPESRKFATEALAKLRAKVQAIYDEEAATGESFHDREWLEAAELALKWRGRDERLGRLWYPRCRRVWGDILPPKVFGLVGRSELEERAFERASAALKLDHRHLTSSGWTCF